MSAPAVEMPRFAALRLPDFRLQAVRRSDPSLAGKPVALILGAGRTSMVAEASPEAGGLEPGCPAILAVARCPALILRERDVEAEVEAQRLLIAAAFTLSPRVEATEGGLCTIDLQGAASLATAAGLRAAGLALARSGLDLRAGLAPTPLLASYAALRTGPSAVLIVDDAPSFLAPLPLAFAAPSPACAALLARWGIATLGGLTALPKAGIAGRLGSVGVALWERAAGETTRPLRLVEPARTFAAEWRYEPPVETLDPLFFKLRRYAERLALELQGAGMVADALALTLLLENGAEHRREFRLPEPCGDPDPWMRILHAHLETVRTPARIASARLVASPARPPQKQDGLFDTGLTDPHAFWENLARLAAVVGEDRVGTPARLDTHRPDSFELRRPAETVPPVTEQAVHPECGPALRRFRPPWPVRVAFADERPSRLEGECLRGAVRTARGPWHLSGEWWRPEAWAVEFWHIEMEGGGLYQIGRTQDTWRVEGMLD